MFKDMDGKWYPFVNEHHERATIEAGYEVRSTKYLCEGILTSAYV